MSGGHKFTTNPGDNVADLSDSGQLPLPYSSRLTFLS